ncbi:MAG: YbaB/EbfC family nucleoid-associated protein, partial [Acetanaerobacterium sp.]
EMEFSATVGGGAVEITMTGKKEVKALSIKPEVVDPEDVEMLQDLLIAAFNEVTNQVETTSGEMMSKVTGGYNMPGMPGMF